MLVHIQAIAISWDIVEILNLSDPKKVQQFSLKSLEKRTKFYIN